MAKVTRVRNRSAIHFQLLYNPTVTDTAESTIRPPLLALAVIVIIIVMFWLCSWTGQQPVSGLAGMLEVISISLPLALLWLVAGAGLGWPLRKWLLPGSDNGLPLQLGLGIAAMLILDEFLGCTGFLRLAGGIGAWLLIAVGLIFLIIQVTKTRQSKYTSISISYDYIFIVTCIPALAVILVAACSAPGWLWSSEFGGYDALSYHLQLPKEWLSYGRIEPLNHNVYSYLPGYVEAAYYHLATLRRNSTTFAYSAQMLHALIAIITALTTTKLVLKHIKLRWLSGIAGTILIGTPWVVVVGSLAYNEMFVALFLTCILLSLNEETISGWRKGVVIGILAAAACGAKLTAVGFVVLPIVIILLVQHKPRIWLNVAIFAFITGIISLSPYLIRNAVYAGNPVFPFLTDIFGYAHWTEEQAAIWRSGHILEWQYGYVSSASIVAGSIDRLGELWNQLIRFGIGTSPYAEGEPWKPQWSLLFLIGAICCASGCINKKYRKISIQLTIIICAQLIFWLLFTHLKSRFMIVAVVPLAASVAIGADMIATRFCNSSNRTKVFVTVIAILACLWSCQSVILFSSESNRAPSARIGMHELMEGSLYKRFLDRTTNQQERAEILSLSNPSLWINHLLPSDSKTLLIGDAAPFYYNSDFAYQTTWDRGPLSEAFDNHPLPNDWLESLKQEGFTHLLINANMLNNWYENGWGDERLKPDYLLDALENHTRLLHVFDETGGVRLYTLE